MASQWGSSIPPPAGVEVNLVDPPSQLPNNIALHTVCLTLSTVLVAIRLYTRIAINKTKLGIDDYLCIISWILSVTFSGLMIKSYTLGIGRHMWDEPTPWLIEGLKWFTIGTFVYLALTGFIKLTFLFFYYRLFSPQRQMKYLITGGIVFVACLNTGLFFSTLFDCAPIAKNWNSYLPGSCFNPVILPYFSGATSCATDIFILLLPIRPLWGLNMSLTQRLRVLAVFGLGVFACVASLVRLGMTPILRSSLDATWNISTIGIWGTIEVNVGIICSCLMLMPAFLDRHLPDSVKSSAARLWSSIVQNLFFRRSSNTSKAEPNSGGRAKKWITFKQKSDSDSQQQVIMNDITTATYQVPSNSNYEANYWTDSIDSQRRDYQKPTSQNRTGEV